MSAAVHPFPARMAPGIALNRLRKLPRRSTVLDPMTGSGTVLRQAISLGHRALGFDVDPLAVLMSKVATDRRSATRLIPAAMAVVSYAVSLSSQEISLPWIDGCRETLGFIRYWFARPQRSALRRLAFSLRTFDQECRDVPTRDALMLALSRIIVTKQRGASLAWDVSHSRPHKVSNVNDFDVLGEFLKSSYELTNLLSESKEVCRRAIVRRGDARKLKLVPAKSVDAIVTSPPYLNAIDYLRGHKLALVWLGYGIPQLREIRADAMGTERGAAHNEHADIVRISHRIHQDKADRRTEQMVNRYAKDLLGITREFARVLKPKGVAHVVVGNCKIRGARINNAAGFVAAAKIAGLELVARKKRELPVQMRYLPVPKDAKNALARRMRDEFVLSFRP